MAACAFLSSLQTYVIPFPVCSFVWSGWLLPVVRSLRHIAQRFFFCYCHLLSVPRSAERRTADPISHYCTATAVAYCVRVELLTQSLFVPFLAGGGSLCAAQTLQVIRSGVCAFVPFDNAKLQPYLL